MYTLQIHKDVASDFQKMRDHGDTAAVLVIAAFLEQAQADPAILDSLSAHGFGERRTAAYRITKWLNQQRLGRNLWSLKEWSLEKLKVRYRVIYAFEPTSRAYFVLGILHRDFSYDESHPRVQSLIATYDRLGISAQAR